jgi:hypothetical protein
MNSFFYQMKNPAQAQYDDAPSEGYREENNKKALSKRKGL